MKSSILRCGGAAMQTTLRASLPGVAFFATAFVVAEATTIKEGDVPSFIEELSGLGARCEPVKLGAECVFKVLDEMGAQVTLTVALVQEEDTKGFGIEFGPLSSLRDARISERYSSIASLIPLFDGSLADRFGTPSDLIDYCLTNKVEDEMKFYKCFSVATVQDGKLEPLANIPTPVEGESRRYLMIQIAPQNYFTVSVTESK